MSKNTAIGRDTQVDVEPQDNPVEAVRVIVIAWTLHAELTTFLEVHDVEENEYLEDEVISFKGFADYLEQWLGLFPQGSLEADTWRTWPIIARLQIQLEQWFGESCRRGEYVGKRRLHNDSDYEFDVFDHAPSAQKCDVLAGALQRAMCDCWDACPWEECEKGEHCENADRVCNMCRDLRMMFFVLEHFSSILEGDVGTERREESVADIEKLLAGDFQLPAESRMVRVWAKWEKGESEC